MRLWTVHPQYLDTRGLVALWREALLAQAVIRGRTRGYRHHPQLDRFREQLAPRAAINAYLQAVHAESVLRGVEPFDSQSIEAIRVGQRVLTASSDASAASPATKIDVNTWRRLRLQQPNLAIS